MRVSQTDIQSCRGELQAEESVCKCPEAGMSLAWCLKHGDEWGEEEGDDGGGQSVDPIASHRPWEGAWVFIILFIYFKRSYVTMHRVIVYWFFFFPPHLNFWWCVGSHFSNQKSNLHHPALKAWSLNDWAVRKVPEFYFNCKRIREGHGTLHVNICTVSGTVC